MEDYSPLFLYRFMTDNYGDDWLEYEPETIEEITIDGETISESEGNMNKIMALQTALLSQTDDEGFHFTDWQIFEKIVLTLNDVVPDFEQIEQADPHEIEGAFALLRQIEDNITFNDEVASYIAATYQVKNIVYCPHHKQVDELLANTELRNDVEEVWNKLPETTDEIVDKIANLEDEVRSYQLKKLMFIEEYTKELVRENERKEREE